MDPKRELLRHALATVAYRGAKAVRSAPADFATFCAADGARTPHQIVLHLGDLFEWALSIAKGSETWRTQSPGPWPDDVSRFFETLERFDAFLASQHPMDASVERLLQGPVADALTHVGQVVMLRRLSGSPIRSENYHRANISAGQVGPDFPPPSREFD